MKKSLIKSEELFRKAFVTSPDSININRLSDGLYVSINSSFTRITGYSEEEIIGRTSYELNIWSDNRDRDRLVEELKAKGKVTNLEARFKMKDGTLIDGMMSATIIDLDGIPHILSITRDVTDKKRIENELKKSETMFRELIELAPDGILLGSHEGIIKGANSRMLRITGRTLDELIGMNFSSLFSDNELKDVPLRYDLLAKGKTVTSMRNFIRPDGSNVSIEMLTAMMPDGTYMSVWHDITERKLTEEALLKSKKQYDELVSKIPVGIYILRSFGDGSFSLDFVSPRMAEMLDTSVEEITSDARKIYEKIYEDDRESFVKLNEEGIKLRRPFDWSGRVKSMGMIKWLHISSTPEPQENGDILWHGTVVDITARKQVEKKLQDSEENMRFIIKHDPNAIAVYDRNLHYIAVSDRYLHDYDVKVDDIKGKHHYEVFPEIPQKWREVHKRCLSGAIERKDDDFFERPDGSITYNRWECRPWRQVDGEIGGIITYTEVTTQQKLAEKALIESERLLRESQNISRLGSFVWDLSSDLWKSSGILDEIFGIDENYCRSYDGWINLIRPDFHKVMKDYVENEVLGKRRKFDKEYPIIRQIDRQARWVHGLGELEFDNDNKPLRLIGTIIDITDRKKAEEEINKLNTSLEERVIERTAQLEAANSELQAFAYSVSHDLRAPLRAIDGFSKFVLEDYGPKLDTEGARLLGLIRSNTMRMDKLITDILSLSRVTRSEHKASRVDMTKMARSMVNEAATPEILGQLNLIIDELPETYADATFIKQVWINLISNAIKFSSLKSVPEIRIGGYTKDDFNVYFISDNGVGFNPEYSHKLFGVFQRLHKADEFEGTGVGLAIVQRIIHRHGGTVWAVGEEGKGATFYFKLPLRKPK
jgi:PAS domain S-box-containing protein